MRFTHSGGGDGGDGAIGGKEGRGTMDGEKGLEGVWVEVNIIWMRIYESLGLVVVAGNGDGFLTEY